MCNRNDWDAPGSSLADRLEPVEDALIQQGVPGDSIDFKGPESLTLERAEAKAAERGQVVVFPDFNELFLDIDSKEAYETYQNNLSIVKQFLTVMGVRETPSRNGGDRKHIVVTLKEAITDVERLVLQAGLGSDTKRELLSLYRQRLGMKTPTMFFETPFNPVVASEILMEKVQPAVEALFKAGDELFGGEDLSGKSDA